MSFFKKVFPQDKYKITATAGSFCAVIAWYLPNSIFLDSRTKMVQTKGNTLPIKETSNSILELAQEVKNDLKVSDEEWKRIQIVTHHQLDAFHMGMLDDNGSGKICVPGTFDHKAATDFSKKDTEPWDGWNLDWTNTNQVSELQRSFVISNRARKFVLARELTQIQTAEPYIKGFISAMMVLCHFWTTRWMQMRYNLFKRPIYTKLALHSGFSMIFIPMLFAQLVFFNGWFNERADDIVGNLGIDYARGGEEYYNSVLGRNQALRALLGKETGGELFMKNGNEKTLITNRRNLLTTRRDNLKVLVEQQQQ